jgi:hypothetical protein
VIDRQMVPAIRFAAVSTFNGCGALSFAGGATTDSYDSRTVVPGTPPAPDNWGGDVGTNGNLSDVGNPTKIWGSLSTPRSGVGACNANNNTITAVTAGDALDNGIVELPQALSFTTPPEPDPLPPTDTTSFGKSSGCPAGVVGCAASANGATITPAGNVVRMGNIDIGSQAVLHLHAGTYVINSFNMNANSTIVIDSGPVIFHIAGQGIASGDTVVKITGNGISNTTYDPAQLQFRYGGPGDIDIAGGAATSALVYAPNATGKFTGQADFYGAVVLKQLTAAGGASIHYDRNLANSNPIPGNFTMNQFTWKAF